MEKVELSEIAKVDWSYVAKSYLEEIHPKLFMSLKKIRKFKQGDR